MPPEAADIIGGCSVSRETKHRLSAFAAALIAENHEQNLISKSSENDMWARHIEDSAQLVRFARDRPGVWLDLGSGAGLPGLVVALLREQPTVLAESRAKRVAFLERQRVELGLANVEVAGGRLETLEAFPAAVISARAFAPLARLLPLASRFSSPETLWILPKGQSAAEELESVRGAWHGDFRIEASLTDRRCGIIVATDVRRKA